MSFVRDIEISDNLTVGTKYWCVRTCTPFASKEYLLDALAKSGWLLLNSQTKVETGGNVYYQYEVMANPATEQLPLNLYLPKGAAHFGFVTGEKLGQIIVESCWEIPYPFEDDTLNNIRKFFDGRYLAFGDECDPSKPVTDEQAFLGMRYYSGIRNPENFIPGLPVPKWPNGVPGYNHIVTTATTIGEVAVRQGIALWFAMHPQGFWVYGNTGEDIAKLLKRKVTPEGIAANDFSDVVAAISNPANIKTGNTEMRVVVYLLHRKVFAGRTGASVTRSILKDIPLSKIREVYEYWINNTTATDEVLIGVITALLGLKGC